MITQAVMAALATFGLSILFATPRRHWLVCSLVGGVVYYLYLAVRAVTGNGVLGCFVATFALVAIARAISTGAPILMADEPTGALDSKTGTQVLDMLHQLHQERGTTILLITHDNKVAATAKRVIRIADGQVVVDCPREEIAL